MFFTLETRFVPSAARMDGMGFFLLKRVLVEMLDQAEVRVLTPTA
jgi:hypothetical protein